MAGIDKTYTDSYKDYIEFKNWADTQTLTFFNGHKECIGDYVWLYEEKDFNDGEIPIMNTPTWLDIYLIQNCKTLFVLDRLLTVYGEDNCKKYASVDLTAMPPEEFKQNRKVTIKKTRGTKFPIHSKPFSNGRWWLSCNNFNFCYDEDSKTWFDGEIFYYPYNTSVSHPTSIKALIKHLRKQYLPIGITFRLSGGNVGEDYLVVIY